MKIKFALITLVSLSILWASNKEKRYSKKLQKGEVWKVETFDVAGQKKPFKGTWNITTDVDIYAEVPKLSWQIDMMDAVMDYVFNPSYALMPLADLRIFIKRERHLPNIPSAAEYAESGVDLGELNRLLLEKTEELTLYILQLEERLHKLETQE